MKMDKTLTYYEKNAKTFAEGTINADISEIQNKFIAFLKTGARVLDFGCGAGRDTKFFLEKGFVVEACDGSEELCGLASENTGISVKQMLFSELNAVDKYDGIWACSSILHLPKKELRDVFIKMIRALKENGVLYTSFKYGDFEGYRGERYFTDFTERTLGDFLADFTELSVVEEWVTADVRPGRDNEKWLNVVLRKG